MSEKFDEMDVRFESVIKDDYKDSNGREVDGVYTTVNASVLIVEKPVFEDLLKREVRREGPSFEEIERIYGDRIIDKFLAANGMVDEFGERCLEPKVVGKRAENQKKATNACVEKGKYNQAVIIKAVLDGQTKLDIEYSLGYCRNTINKALKNLNKQTFEDIWYKYKADVFADLGIAVFRDFVACDCDYKKWMSLLALRSELAFKKTVDGIIAEQEALKKAGGSDDSGVMTFDDVVQMFGAELV